MWAFLLAPKYKGGAWINKLLIKYLFSICLHYELVSMMINIYRGISSLKYLQYLFFLLILKNGISTIWNQSLSIITNHFSLQLYILYNQISFWQCALWLQKEKKIFFKVILKTLWLHSMAYVGRWWAHEPILFFFARLLMLVTEATKCQIPYNYHYLILIELHPWIIQFLIFFFLHLIIINFRWSL